MEFFFVKILRDINNRRRDLKLDMERKAKIERKETRVFGDSAQTKCSNFLEE